MTAEVNTLSKKRIGEILQEAGLISSQQLDKALQVQKKNHNLKIGEVIASKGWLKQETVDFLACICHGETKHTEGLKPVGYYFQQAGLLTKEQIDNLVKQQKALGIKFCYLAVMKGLIKQETADFFLDKIVNRMAAKGNKIKEENSEPNYNIQTVIIEGDLWENIKDYDTITEENNQESDTLTSSEDSDASLSEIQFTPIWIDA